MLRTRRQPKISPQDRPTIPRRRLHQPNDENSSSSQQKKDQSGYKRLHKNACRTIVCDFLQYRSQKINKLKNPSLWLISKTYLKKLEHFQTRLQNQPQERPKERKISWSEQAEYVVFNQRKSSATISSSQRHTFSLNDQ